MSRDSYYVATYWGNREESADECARRASLLLDDLSRRDECLRTWFNRGKSRKDALAQPVDISEKSLRSLLMRGRNRYDADGAVIEDLGFRLAVWNGGSGGGDCGLSLHCGSCASTPSTWIPNSCVLSLPNEGEAVDRLLSVPLLLRIIEAMVATLEPDWGVATSYAYQETLPPGEPGAPVVGWLTYLREPPQRLPSFLPGVHVVPVADFGSVIVTTEERFAAGDPRHVQVANSASHALSASGLLRRPA